MFGLFKSKKDSLSASTLAEITYDYQQRSEKIMRLYLDCLEQPVTKEREDEVVAFCFTIYSQALLESNFPADEKELAVKTLLKWTFVDKLGDPSVEFLTQRHMLYASSVSNVNIISKYGSSLLAQFVTVCNIGALDVIDEFNNMAETVSEMLRTAIERNNDLAKNATIQDL